MREKRPVTFRMAPKKSTKGKDVEPEPTRDEGWLPSKCAESDLQSLVKEGLLHSRSVVQWRPALGHIRPYENTGEIVAFAPYFERGLGLPCSNFFSGLLYYYGIQLHHLTPNSFVHILPSYICAKLFWASSPTLSSSAIFSTSNPNLTQRS